MHEHVYNKAVINIGGVLEIRGEDVTFHPNLLLRVLSQVLLYGYFLFFWSMSYLRFKELEL